MSVFQLWISANACKGRFGAYADQVIVLTEAGRIAIIEKHNYLESSAMSEDKADEIPVGTFEVLFTPSGTSLAAKTCLKSQCFPDLVILTLKSTTEPYESSGSAGRKPRESSPGRKSSKTVVGLIKRSNC